VVELKSIAEERHRRKGGGWKPGAGGLPKIRIFGGKLPELVDQAEEALIAAGGLGLYQRGGEIIRPVLEETPGADGTKTQSWRLQAITRSYLRECLTRAAEFLKIDKHENDIRIDCPKDIAETYASRVGLWKLRPLVGIVNTPLLRGDGTLLDKPGYDAVAGLLFEPEGQVFPPIPANPTKEEAQEALLLFIDLLRTFPFVAPADQTVAVSAILTAVARRSMTTAPLHAFTAPSPGSGKSLLVNVACVIATGRRVAAITQGRKDEELESRLVGMLLAGHGHVSVDNCDRPLGGPQLCTALSEERANLRKLGSSEVYDVAMNAMFFATGNNLVLLDDLGRRTVTCTIDAREERPELRGFEGDLLGQVRRDRGLYVGAALTILRAYQVAEMPERLKPLASFEQWSNRVRSALWWLGMADPCDTMARARADDPVTSGLATVLAGWKEAIGDREVTTREIIAKANEEYMGELCWPDFKAALETVAIKGHAIDGKRLGEWLQHVKGRIIGGVRISKADKLHRTGVSLWFIE
jgi:hypothetical protein